MVGVEDHLNVCYTPDMFRISDIKLISCFHICYAQTLLLDFKLQLALFEARQVIRVLAVLKHFLDQFVDERLSNHPVFSDVSAAHRANLVS